ncbi:MAG: alkaline phosphatase D family protein [Myxococcota bacterium]
MLYRFLRFALLGAVVGLVSGGCPRSAPTAGEAPGKGGVPGPAGRRSTATVPAVGHVPLPMGDPLRQIALGSCLDQDKPQPIWASIAQYDPQLFLLMGDNVYADAETPAMFGDAYRALAAQEGFAEMVRTTPLLATWDDHDYGRNDAGSEYPLKEEAQRFFLDFFGVPADSPRRTRPGIYDAVVVGPPGQRVQIILLDTRFFRTPLFPIAPSRYNDVDDSDATMLGDAQWAWLAEQLKTPAELRLLVSSVQVVANEHDRERWGVFPHQRERLLRLIGETRASGVVVLSGDRHRGELSRLSGSAAGYPIYDLTSSSLNRPLPAVEENSTRLGALVTGTNYGTIDIVWEGQAHVVLALREQNGRVAVEHTVALDALRAP